MAVSRNVEFTGAVSSSGTTVTTGSATPSNGDMVIVWCCNDNTQTAAPTISTSTGSYTWTQFGSTVSFTNEGNAYIFTAQMTGTPSAFTITATWDTAGDSAIWAAAYSGADTTTGNWNSASEVSSSTTQTIGTPAQTGATDSKALSLFGTSHSEASSPGTGYDVDTGFTQLFRDVTSGPPNQARCIMGVGERTPSGGSDAWDWDWSGSHAAHDDVAAYWVEITVAGGGPETFVKDPIGGGIIPWSR